MSIADDPVPTWPHPVIAVNLLLEPDATMVDRAVANNARLLEVFPQGFALGEERRPHITLLQRFVRTADLEPLLEAAGSVFAATDVRSLQLEALGYYFIPNGPLGLAGIVSSPVPELREVQQQLIDAVAPFTVATGGSDAFGTTPDDPIIDPLLIDYVATFVPNSTGERFNPHVTTGIGPREYLDAMVAEPFEPFTHAPAGAAAYLLGQYGTVVRRLRAFAA